MREDLLQMNAGTSAMDLNLIKMKDNFDIFFRRKPALILVSLKKNSRM